MKKISGILVGSAALVTLVIGCVNLSSKNSRNPSGSAVVYEKPPGLSGADLANFEHLSEGADIYPYEWMKALRSVAFKDANDKATKPFYSDFYNRFGILPSSNLKDENGNTYLIPYVGLTAAWSNHPPQQSEAYKETEEEIVRQIGEVKSIKMVGTNCSFCHSGSLDFRGTNYRVQGTQSTTDVRSFFKDMATSTLAVLAKEEAAVDFLKRMKVSEPERKAKELHEYFLRRLGETTYGLVKVGPISAQLTLIKAKYLKDTHRLYRGKQAIADSLEKLLRMTYGFSETDDIGELKARMKFLGTLMVGTDPKTDETESGYGRTDAFGRIGNLVLRGDDAISYTAPVSLPWIWGIKYMAMLHYNGNSNSVILRNVGQSLGLGALILDKDGTSTVNVHNLGRLEALVHKIQVPRWEKVFAGVTELQVNQQLAERGRQVYESRCIECHESNKFVGPSGQLRLYNMMPLAELGTDPNAARNAVKSVGTVHFEDSIFNGVGGVKARYYQKNNMTDEQQAEIEYRSLRGKEFFRDTLNGYANQEKNGLDYGNVDAGTGYKARHLAGVWATAPFLHNGSVPSMWDLLQPAHLRPKIFNVKDKEFNPVKMGLKYEREKNMLGFTKSCGKGEQRCFDTTLTGNHNTGHEGRYYGTDLPDADKHALIEYLKVLPPEPEYSW
ncbi:di-heme-cytochrome C peroxidase [Bdellovibrio svalbardensis]|uniref:Di-heme-cytochrome C peroxidase n=1 Tax=Bdellovibrio svalbardensis TaxID=2972972 RepID=A0ABT6DI60_9BACT|nr:di-heme-cytochrome C peroxidase [Bdellovibrio svalbardensis]MDG0814788.1 di-heme-cytochrome C peroxidase [Bdellovibrio svalbardensis]